MNEDKFYNRFGQELEDTFEAHYPLPEHQTPMLSGPYAGSVMIAFVAIGFLVISGVLFVIETLVQWTIGFKLF